MRSTQAQPPPVIAADEPEGLDYSLQLSYGDVSLTAEFPSDPHRMDLTSGGAVSVAYLNYHDLGHAVR